MGDRATRRAGVMSADQQAMAAVYAQALLDHLCAGDAAKTALDELQSIVALLNEIEHVDALLAIPLSVEARLGLVERIFRGRVSEAVYALLAVMAKRGRMMLLRAVVGEYGKLIETAQGKIEVTVTTAGELSDLQRDALVADLARTFAAEPILTMRTDPAIIGGAVVQVGDKAYDASLASDLVRFARELTHSVAAQSARGTSSGPVNN